MHPSFHTLVLTAALAAGSFDARAQDTRDAEIAALKQQLAELAAKVQDLEERTAAKPDANVDSATRSDTLASKSPKLETKGGIKVTSADKNFEASLGGRIHFDAYAFDQDVASATDTTEFRRARLTLAGKAYGWEYKVEQDFAAGSNLDGIRDLYIARKMLGGKLTIGQFKPYRSMEELTSSNDILMMERPSTSATGIYNGRQFQQGVGYLRAGDNYSFGMSAFNMRSAPTPRNEGVGFSGRATWAPINNGTSTLHLGASISHENLNKGSPNATAVSSYAGRRGPSLTVAATTVAGSGGNDSQVDTRALEAAFASGPFFVQSEYARARFGQGAGGAHDVDAFYVQGSWMLNGGMRVYKAGTGVFGAPKVADKGLWELTARWDTIENNDLADTGTTSTILGLNYYLNPNMRVMFNYLRGENDKTGDEPSQFAIRTQFAF